ncbi:MAG: hypothetical protein WBJ46_03155, partial [Rectinema sp.]
ANKKLFNRVIINKPDVGVSIKIPHGFSDRKWWVAHTGCLECNMCTPCRQQQFMLCNLLLQKTMYEPT